jgi:hypothetical protein
MLPLQPVDNEEVIRYQVTGVEFLDERLDTPKKERPWRAGVKDVDRLPLPFGSVRF